MISSIVFSVFLMLASLVLLVLHWRKRKAFQRAQRMHGEQDFADFPYALQDFGFVRKQLRRRILASAIVGAIGAMVLGSVWIGSGWHTAVYWLVVLVLTALMVIVAVLDYFATKSFAGELQTRHLAQSVALRKELQQIQDRHESEEDSDE